MSLNLLLQSRKTVFRVSDIGKILNITNNNYLLVHVNRLKKRGVIAMIKKGIYALSNGYDEFELANKIKIPSYVSLQTMLFKHGIIFQDFSDTITSVSNNTVSLKIKGKNYFYHKIKNEILTNPTGVVTENQVRMAIPERAIADTIYLFKDFYFDNIENIDKKLLLSIGKNYNQQVFYKIKKICSIK